MRWPGGDALLSLALVLLAILEGVVLHRRGRYDARAAATSIFLAIGRRAIDRAPLWLTLPLAQLLYEHRLADVPATGALRWLGLLAGLELAHYVSHRMAHRVRWLWASHAVHHSTTELNFAAAYRLGWTGRLTGTIACFSPLALFGYPPEEILGVYTVVLVYQVWLHAAWVPPLGPLEGWLNTPSAHRVHHASAPAYRDRNFGGVTVLFDRLFGTYAAERPEIETGYGWVTPELARSPIHVLLEPYRELAHHVRRARTPRALVQALFGPPDPR